MKAMRIMRETKPEGGLRGLIHRPALVVFFVIFLLLFGRPTIAWHPQMDYWANYGLQWLF